MFKKILLVLSLCALSSTAWATKEYEDCINQVQNDDDVALCMKAETARVMKDIQEVYLNLSKHYLIEPWNNGVGLSKGNLKDMYDHWVAYRNRYCSLYQQASINTFRSDEFHKEECLMQLTIDHYELVHTAIINANVLHDDEPFGEDEY